MSDEHSSPSSSSGRGTSPPRRIIGYYAGWTSKTKHYTPADIPAARLTHVNYAFGLIDADGNAMLGDPAEDVERPNPSHNADADGLMGNFQQLRRLKERHPHLRTLISIGGWTGSGRFSDAVATEERRRGFVASCIELFLTRWPGVFDGIDIDWEYPVCCGLPENGYRPEDRQHCTLLFAELRRQLDQLGAATGQHYLLTAALPAGRELPLGCFDVPATARILDWINVMTYDMNGAEASGVTNFNAPLRESSADPRSAATRREWSVAGTVQVFEDAGVPRDRIVVGVPFYGRGFTGVPNVDHGLYQPFTGTMAADYHTIVADYLSRPAFARLQHPQAGVPWLYDAERGVMLSYDDPASIARKTDYVIAQGLGGVMIWELSGDDAQMNMLTAISSRLRP